MEIHGPDEVGCYRSISTVRAQADDFIESLKFDRAGVLDMPKTKNAPVGSEDQTVVGNSRLWHASFGINQGSRNPLQVARKIDWASNWQFLHGGFCKEALLRVWGDCLKVGEVENRSGASADSPRNIKCQGSGQTGSNFGQASSGCRHCHFI